ncbi:MAG: hypothetical protein N2654_04920 [Deltaproteobacteria bacterium]|nr:hypothetical protein [Deltaproteobacteria bacterium]
MLALLRKRKLREGLSFKEYASTLVSELFHSMGCSQGTTRANEIDKLIAHYREKSTDFAVSLASFNKIYSDYVEKVKADSFDPETGCLRLLFTLSLLSASPFIAKGVMWFLGLSQSAFVHTSVATALTILCLYFLIEINDRQCYLTDSLKSLKRETNNKLNREKLHSPTCEAAVQAFGKPFRMLKIGLPKLNCKQYDEIVNKAREVLRARVKDSELSTSNGVNITESGVIKAFISVAGQIRD